MRETPTTGNWRVPLPAIIASSMEVFGSSKLLVNLKCDWICFGASHFTTQDWKINHQCTFSHNSNLGENVNLTTRDFSYDGFSNGIFAYYDSSTVSV